MNFVFFDTETTGNTTEDVLCQVAYVKVPKDKLDSSFDIFCELYNPGKKIPPEASAVHHISNKMVSEKPSFKESSDYKEIKSIFEDKENIPVAHNAKFDVGMFLKEGIEIKNPICTLRLVRNLDENNSIPRYNLQFLRYYLDMDIDAQAHDAKGDVMVLQNLFKRLFKKFVEKNGGDEEKAIEEMIEVSSHPSLLHTIPFGKYAGKKISDIAQEDSDYLRWLLSQKEQSEADEEDWIYTLKYYLEK